jgi:hypothetical protein
MKRIPACNRCGRAPIYAVLTVSASIVETGQHLRLGPGASGTAYCARCVIHIVDAMQEERRAVIAPVANEGNG